jgi:FtsP/CotA-like multicopper oxidase with cupredoxin domain
MEISRRSFLKTTLGATASLSLSPWLGSYLHAKTKGKIREFHFTASRVKINLGTGPDLWAWTYNGQVPGPEIRVKEGDIIRVILKNNLPEETSIHWHGVPLPNAMDGVPGVTQKGIMPGEIFIYEFEAKPAGTFIYHSHAGYQMDQGLYGALIIEPSNQPRDYDREYTLMLEDWVMKDEGGVAKIMRRPPAGPQNRGIADGGIMGGKDWQKGGENLLEPVYDGYAVNGKVYPEVDPVRVKKGDRVRIRLGNVSSATIYDLRLAGHTLIITHADGNPVQPKEVDVLRIAMGERYDVEFLANNPGRWLLSARDKGFGESKLRVPLIYDEVKTGELVSPDFPPNLRLNRYADLQALYPEPGPDNPPKRSYYQKLGWRMEAPHWVINAEAYPKIENLSVMEGEWVHIKYFNHTPMPHPMHLHGHFFRIVNPSIPPELWIKKDTFVFDRLDFMDIQFLADNPGRWFHHCHNLYHMVDGMANEVYYKT